MKIRRLMVVIPVLAVVGWTGYLLLREKAYAGPVSDHFDGSRFFNPEPDHTFIAMVKWLWQMKTVEWPSWIEDPPQPKPPEFVKGSDLRFTYVNHATTLIQTDSVNILTDPIWSDRAGPLSWIGTKRVRAPGLRFDDLPRIDVVLISHDHYDHLDLPTLKRLVGRSRPVILVGLGVRRLLESEGIANVIEMDWWQSHVLQSSGLRITFVPALHTSGRPLFGGDQTLWGGFVIEGSGGRIYFAGDTGYGRFLQEMKNRFDGFRLAVLPIGNYEKRSFMKFQHMNPDDAVLACKQLNCRQSVGIHFATFVEHPEQAIDAHEWDLRKALFRYGVPESRFWIPKFGESRIVPL